MKADRHDKPNNFTKIELGDFEFHDINEAYEEARHENLLTEQMIVNSSKLNNSNSHELDDLSIP